MINRSIARLSFLGTIPFSPTTGRNSFEVIPFSFRTKDMKIRRSTQPVRHCKCSIGLKNACIRQDDRDMNYVGMLRQLEFTLHLVDQPTGLSNGTGAFKQLNLFYRLTNLLIRQKSPGRITCCP